MILLALLMLLGLLLILVPVLQREVVALQEQFPSLVSRLNSDLAPRINELFGTAIRFDSQTLKELLAERVGGQDNIVGKIIEHARAGGMALLGIVGTLFLVPVVLFFTLLDYHSFTHRSEALIPRRWRHAAVGMVNEIDRLLAHFLRGQMSVMGILAVYFSIALTVAGLQAALPIGLLTGLLIFIPYVGFGLGLLLALLTAILQFGNWYGLIAVAVVYGIGQVIESFFLTPRLLGESIGLHPLAVILALLSFGQIFGFFGILLALPASAALLVAVRRVKATYLASDFYNQT
jgi:predicted PurR-regulated permease PerM